MYCINELSYELSCRLFEQIHILTSGITSAGFSFFLLFRQNNMNAKIITTKIANETAATKTVNVGLVSIHNWRKKQNHSLIL